MPADFSFAGSFNESLPTAEAVFGEFIVLKDGTQVECISTSDMTRTTKQSFGGKLEDATATVSMRKAVAAANKMDKGDVITVKGIKVRIMDEKPRTNDSITFVCGPVSPGVQFS